MSYFNYYAASQLFHGSALSMMGTRLDVLMLGADTVRLQSVWEKIVREVARMDKMMNKFDPSSEVSRVNRFAGQYPVEVSAELWHILNDCAFYYGQTDGLFDVTLRNFKQVLLSEADRTVFFFSESLQVDLGGYGKGYALLKIQDLLNENGIRQALVNFGNSSVLALGSHPYGEYWPVCIENPYTGRLLADFTLCDQALSVSGNMPSHPRHIVNPHTGVFVEEAELVAVVAKDPLVAEVLTTTFMVADTEQMASIAGKFEMYEKKRYKL